MYHRDLSLIQRLLEDYPKQQFEKNKTVIASREECRKIGFLHSGSLSATLNLFSIESIWNIKETEKKHSYFVNIFGEGSWFGIQSVCFKKTNLLYKTLESCVVTLFDGDVFFKSAPRELLLDFTYHVNLQQLAMHWTKQKKILEKILHYLFFVSVMTQKIEFVASHQQIADLVGSTRSTVSRILKELEKEGLIKCQSKRIEFLENFQETAEKRIFHHG